MTLRAIVQIVGRRWCVVVLIFAVAAGLYVTFLTVGGVYSTRTTVLLMMPHESDLTPDSSTSSETVIAFAGTVASTIGKAYPAVRYSAADAPYYGAGIRQGVLVALRDEGSQWAPSYGSAVIDIQVVGPTHDWVRARQETVLTQIEQLARASQMTAGAAADEQIVARPEPLSLEIEHIQPSTIAMVAAGAAMLASSVLVSMWAAIAADGLLHNRARISFGGSARGSD